MVGSTRGAGLRGLDNTCNYMSMNSRFTGEQWCGGTLAWLLMLVGTHPGNRGDVHRLLHSWCKGLGRVVLAVACLRGMPLFTLLSNGATQPLVAPGHRHRLGDRPNSG